MLHELFDVLTSRAIFPLFVIGFHSRRHGTEGVEDME